MRVALCAAWLLACTPEAEVATARLTLAELPSCALRERLPMALRASGDFPAIERELDGPPPFAIDAFPPDTRYVAVEAGSGRERAGGLVALNGGDQQASALLLPFGESCPLGDPLFAAPPLAAVAALPGGGVLIAGGSDAAGAARANAVVLEAGAALATEVDGGMLLRRAGASATRSGERVVIAGGAPDRRGPAHDTFEIYDPALGAFDTALSEKLAGGPRRDHGAARLPDGRVLIAGGVAELETEPLAGAELETEPLASAELIDVVAGRATKTMGELRVARTQPTLLALDSGTVLVALGLDADERPVTEVERYDAEEQRFERVADLPEHAHAAVAALEGDRVAYVGCDGEGAPCELALLVPVPEAGGFARAPLPPLELEFDPDTMPPEAETGLYGLEHLRALGLPDGRLLIIGRRPRAPVERSAFLVDLGLFTIAPTLVSRVAEHLLVLEDGSIVELDDARGSLRREDAQGELDNPPGELLDPESLRVALDAATRWQVDDDGLLALDEARLDLPRLRFAELRVELELDPDGQGRLLLEPEAAPAVEIAINAERIDLAGCSLARTSEPEITIERHAAEVVLRSGSSSRRCSADALDGRVGVALRVADRTRIRGLRVTRL